EVKAEANDLASVARHWVLKAPAGPITDRFHFLICDGVQPPLTSQTFDTVVTPWFIDIVPADLRNFITEVYRLLKPGGRWINFGPLRYRQDIPVTRRFSRDEIFDLAV